MRFGLRLLEIFSKLACKSCFFFILGRIELSFADFYFSIESGIHGSSRVRKPHCFLSTLLLGP